MYPGHLNNLIANKRAEASLIVKKYYADPTFIPVYLSGGIGDVIMGIQAIDGLAAQYNIVVYSPHAEAFNYFNSEVKVIKGSVPDFTWYLEINTVSRFNFTDQFAGFLTEDTADLFRKQLENFKEQPLLETLVKNHPRYDFILSQYARDRGLNRRSFALASLGKGGLVDSKFPRAMVHQGYITIHDGFDTANFSDLDGRATKQWKWGHWNELVRKIKKEYPGRKIIQLGSTTGRPIDGVDECLLNKTTITEAFDILRGSSLHIDGDSGLVHAATRMGVRCVVMFGPTPEYFYGYPSNINIRSSKTCQEACYWVNDKWMNKCTVGYMSPQCMDEIEPEQVMGSVRMILNENSARKPMLS